MRFMKAWKQKRSGNKAFTLTEALIGTAIMAVVASAVYIAVIKFKGEEIKLFKSAHTKNVFESFAQNFVGDLKNADMAYNFQNMPVKIGKCGEGSACIVTVDQENGLVPTELEDKEIKVLEFFRDTEARFDTKPAYDSKNTTMLKFQKELPKKVFSKSEEQYIMWELKDEKSPGFNMMVRSGANGYFKFINQFGSNHPDPARARWTMFLGTAKDIEVEPGTLIVFFNEQNPKHYFVQKVTDFADCSKKQAHCRDIALKAYTGADADKDANMKTIYDGFTYAININPVTPQDVNGFFPSTDFQHNMWEQDEAVYMFPSSSASISSPDNSDFSRPVDIRKLGHYLYSNQIKGKYVGIPVDVHSYAIESTGDKKGRQLVLKKFGKKGRRTLFDIPEDKLSRDKKVVETTKVAFARKLGTQEVSTFLITQKPGQYTLHAGVQLKKRPTATPSTPSVGTISAKVTGSIRGTIPRTEPEIPKRMPFTKGIIFTTEMLCGDSDIAKLAAENKNWEYVKDGDEVVQNVLGYWMDKTAGDSEAFNKTTGICSRDYNTKGQKVKEDFPCGPLPTNETWYPVATVDLKADKDQTNMMKELNKNNDKEPAKSILLRHMNLVMSTAGFRMPAVAEKDDRFDFYAGSMICKKLMDGDSGAKAGTSVPTPSEVAYAFITKVKPKITEAMTSAANNPAAINTKFDFKVTESDVAITMGSGKYDFSSDPLYSVAKNVIAMDAGNIQGSAGYKDLYNIHNAIKGEKMCVNVPGIKKPKNGHKFWWEHYHLQLTCDILWRGVGSSDLPALMQKLVSKTDFAATKKELTRIVLSAAAMQSAQQEFESNFASYRPKHKCFKENTEYINTVLNSIVYNLQPETINVVYTATHPENEYEKASENYKGPNAAVNAIFGMGGESKPLDFYRGKKRPTPDFSERSYLINYKVRALGCTPPPTVEVNCCYCSAPDYSKMFMESPSI